jgi:hypothetical protein
MNQDFIPGDSRTLLLTEGTRVMLFQEEGVWLAMAVDSNHCVQGRTLEELEKYWIMNGEAYVLLRKDEKKWWEPPKPIEYEAVWESGTPHEFYNTQARMVDYNEFKKASSVYHKRYKSYGFGLTEEEKKEFDAKKVQTS